MQVSKQASSFMDGSISKDQSVFFGKLIVHSTACSQCDKNENS